MGQVSHGAYYGNKAAFHFLGKMTVAAVKVQGGVQWECLVNDIKKTDT